MNQKKSSQTFGSTFPAIYIPTLTTLTGVVRTRAPEVATLAMCAEYGGLHRVMRAEKYHYLRSDDTCARRYNRAAGILQTALVSGQRDVHSDSR